MVDGSEYEENEEENFLAHHSSSEIPRVLPKTDTYFVLTLLEKLNRVPFVQARFASPRWFFPRVKVLEASRDS